MTNKSFGHRNPLIVTPMGNFLDTLGDCHMGRVFRNDVPLDRRGEYEKFQLKTLNQLLNKPLPKGCNIGNTLKVQVGDWFDKANVSAAAVLESYEVLHNLDWEGDKYPLFVIAGNHDDSKNITEKTSWDILEQLIQPFELINFVKKWSVYKFENGEQVLLIGWNITTSAIQALLEAKKLGYNNITTVVCHLDRISYGNEENVIPYEFFASHGIKMVVSGHEHKPYYFIEQGMDIVGTGSMLPYSHAEESPIEPEGLYLTFKTLTELETYVAEGGDTENKHIRVYLSEGETAPDLPDVYSLKTPKAEMAEVDLNTGETIVQVGEFDAHALWREAAAEKGLSLENTNLVWSQIKEHEEEE